MKFVKAQRHGPFQDTSRKRSALARKQRKEREKFPLFSVVIAEGQPEADTVMEKRAIQWDQWQQSYRDDRAAKWREARKRLAEYDDNLRPRLRHLWNTSPYPKTPAYLLDMLHSYNVGRLDPDNPPWVYKGPGLKAFDMSAIIHRAQARKLAADTRLQAKTITPPFELTAD